MKPLSADQINSVLGRKTTAAERHQFRTAVESRNYSKTNRTDQKDPNPYRTALDQLLANNWHPRTASDRRRVQRLTDQAEARDREIERELDAAATRIVMATDADVQAAQKHYAEVLSSFEAEDAQDVNEQARCLGCIDRAMQGDRSALSDYYMIAAKFCDRHMQKYQGELEDARKEAADARDKHLEREATFARMERAALQPPFRADGLESQFDN